MAGQAPVRRLAVFDLDGTLSRHDTFVPFVIGTLLRHPARWPRALLLLAPSVAYLLRRLDRGGLKGAIVHRLFAGMPRSVIVDRARRYAAAVVPARMFAAAVAALRGHVAAGDHVVLLSASPDLYVPEIARALGAHDAICTELRWSGDLLDGRLAGPNCREHEKARILQQLRARLPGLPVIAYGNSRVDLVHMVDCEQAVYVNADPALAAELAARGMDVVRWS